MKFKLIINEKGDYYEVKIADKKIVKWYFDSFREGGYYKVKDEISELLDIYERCDNKQEAKDFIFNICRFTDYSYFRVIGEMVTIKADKIRKEISYLEQQKLDSENKINKLKAQLKKRLL